MGTVFINNISQGEGNSIVINGNRVIVNGKDVTPDSKVIEIRIEGDVQTLEVDYASYVTVGGNAGSLRSGSGKVNIIGHVTGDVDTGSGSVDCGDVGGSVKTGSGDVEITGSVAGSVKTGSGDIKYRK